MNPRASRACRSRSAGMAVSVTGHRLARGPRGGGGAVMAQLEHVLGLRRRGMAIGISEDHAELAASIRKWARALAPREAARAAEGDPQALADWSERYAETGLATIAVPEPIGGGGS